MKLKISLALCICIVILILGIGIGSVNIPPLNIFRIILHQIFGFTLPRDITPATVAIVWNLRLPRTILAFFVGAALSVSGAVMQSVLRNPLASSFTLGVASGASLGASLVIFLGVSLPLIPMMTLPVLGFSFGLGTIFIVIAIATRMDKGMGNHTIILLGMIFSLFVNALTTLMFALFREGTQRMINWQMGSFVPRTGWNTWDILGVLVPIVIIGVFLIYRKSLEMDILTFGEEQAQTIGVNTKRAKRVLLIYGAALTGGSLAFTGIIGFVDLVAPHIVRRIYGSNHKIVVIMSAVFGGGFMVLADLIARTIIAPVELPVGVITALVGAPFFGYIYFIKRKD